MRPDEITLRFTPLGFATGSLVMRPEGSLRHLQESIGAAHLADGVPEDVRQSFDRVRNGCLRTKGGDDDRVHQAFRADFTEGLGGAGQAHSVRHRSAMIRWSCRGVVAGWLARCLRPEVCSRLVASRSRIRM